uniref:XK-related protein n=1 Tax=Elaeophora elaphi TaxID=1147741 RepID=A0A0R3RTD1_9BILA
MYIEFQLLIIYIADTIEDFTDRLPHTLTVRNFDIFCFVFSAVSYLADIGSDATAAYIHYCEHRMWAFIFITVFTVLPSLILNIVSFLWWIDDISAHTVRLGMKHAYSKQLIFRIVMCLLQVSPIIWYVEAILAAIKFRMAEKRSEKLASYTTMIQAERDAALLRFFEAFLESVPQMLVQGIALAHSSSSVNPWNNFPNWILIQMVSISFSLLSSCWSFVIQHRSLRLSRPDKENITPSGALIQPFETESSSKSVEVGLVVICAAVHFFAPYNMAEGRSRYRYTVAYSIEAIEIFVLLNMAMGNEHCSLPYKEYMAIGIYLLFLIGIFFMLLYYGYFHPNMVHCRAGGVPSSCVQACQIV